MNVKPIMHSPHDLLFFKIINQFYRFNSTQIERSITPLLITELAERLFFHLKTTYSNRDLISFLQQAHIAHQLKPNTHFILLEMMRSIYYIVPQQTNSANKPFLVGEYNDLLQGFLAERMNAELALEIIARKNVKRGHFFKPATAFDAIVDDMELNRGQTPVIY